jgi:hypothetical protein
MDFASFVHSSLNSSPPKKLSPALRALWLDRNGSWERAHEEIQHEEDQSSAATHAYLHRKEGDLWNARYWYKRAKRKEFNGSLEQEWESLVKEFLDRSAHTAPPEADQHNQTDA